MELRTTQISTKQLHQIYKNINKHALSPKKVKIIAVTKNFNISAIKEAVENNILIIGENKVQEAEKKIYQNNIRNQISLHLIGHLQSNKVKKAVKIFNVIETVDSKKIMEKINTAAEKTNKKQKIYIQINIGKDKKKHGISTKEIKNICLKAQTMKNIVVEGIMTVLPNKTEKSKQREYFGKMNKIQKKIKEKYIKTCTNMSMGMSQDYLEAIKLGATHIRIGSLLFGQRK